MKKLIISLILIFLMLPTFVFANEITTNDYVINIPDSFTQVLENSFTDENGHNINIQMNYYDSSETIEYTEEYLDSIISEVTDNLEQYKEDLKSQMSIQYGDSVSEDVIDGIVETLKFNDFPVKEITTFGADNYPCLHYISNVSMQGSNQYSEIYQTHLDGTIYTVTINTQDEDFFEQEEIKNAVKSFKINNYAQQILNEEEPTNEQYIDNQIILLTMIALAIIIIIIVIVIIIKKTSKKKSSKDDK